MASTACSDQQCPTPCTVQDLLEILTEPADGFMMMPSMAMNEVYPNLYVGDIASAKNIFRLENTGITHVVNTAQGTTRCHVNINAEFYEKHNITFKGITAEDAAGYELDKHFEETADFIEQALENGGKILVYCREGCSRSATIAIAFLMLRRHMTVQEAMTKVREHREVCPNDGFLQILCNLNEQLLKSGTLNAWSKKEETDCADGTLDSKGDDAETKM